MTITRRGRTGSFLLLGALSAAGYVTAALAFCASNVTAGLPWMVALFLTLSVIWGLALWSAQKAPPRLALVLGFAVLFRLLLLPAGYAPQSGGYERFLLYDDRAWRYLWEGHVWALGLDPLTTPPAQLDELEVDLSSATTPYRPERSRLWSRVLDNVSSREMASPYPVGAHALFRLAHAVAPGSVLFWKLLMLGLDLVTIGILARLAGRQGLGTVPVLAYAWNPLVIKEFAGSGHVDAALVCLMVLAVSARPAVGSVWLAAAGLVKPVALLLTPTLVHRGGWRALVAPAIAVTLLVYRFPRGLVAYATDLMFNPALYRLVPIPRAGLMGASGLVVGASIVYVWRTDDGSHQSLARHAVLLIGATLLLTPVLSPWYLTWVLPFAALTQSTFWLAFSGSVFLAYHGYLDRFEQPVVVLLELAAPLLLWWSQTSHRTTVDTAEPPIGVRTIVSVSSAAAAVGGLCCLAPIVIVLFGLSSMTFAASLGNVLYGDYRWAFRLLSIASGAGGLVVYFRRRGVCTLDEAKRRWRAIADVALITLFTSATAYVLLTYVVLQSWGVRAGLPWQQYDESWTWPMAIVLLLITVALFVTGGSGRRWGRDPREEPNEEPQAQGGTQE